MATLNELLDIDGVVAAGEFTADGKLVDYIEPSFSREQQPSGGNR